MTHTLRNELQQNASTDETVNRDLTETPWLDAQWADLATVVTGGGAENESPGPAAA